MNPDIKQIPEGVYPVPILNSNFQVIALLLPEEGQLDTISALANGAIQSSEIGTTVASQGDFATHLADTDNPHLVTAAQAGALALTQIGSLVPAVDDNGYIPSEYFPPQFRHERFSASSEATMLALDAQPGDWCIRSDDGNHTWELFGDDPTQLSSWVRQLTTTDAPVQSVNGQTGTVLVNDNNLSTLDPTNSNAPTTLRTVLANIYASLVLAFSLCADRTLSNLTNYTTARSNLGLGNSATRSVGTTAGTVAAGDHTHTGISGAIRIYPRDINAAPSNLTSVNVGYIEGFYVENLERITLSATYLRTTNTDTTPGATLEWGVYAANGSLVFKTGAQSAALGNVMRTISLSNVVLDRGIYYFAWTTNSSSLGIQGFSSGANSLWRILNGFRSTDLTPIPGQLPNSLPAVTNGSGVLSIVPAIGVLLA